ncbi:hypothetical protein Lal_00038901 [Lupinus albus]|nr:hypothetical protein Lal_00038901 [Lupinus albus]
MVIHDFIKILLYTFILIFFFLKKSSFISFTVALFSHSGIKWNNIIIIARGRTTHSKLAIPVPTYENSTCNIHQGSELAELLKQKKLIIWDEAPMTHKYCFEALDKTLTDIMSFRGKGNSTFGGKVIVFVVLTLTRNMRLRSTINNTNHLQIQQFAKWILDVGDGKLSEPNDGYALIEIPEQFLITNYDNPIHAIVKSTYLNLVDEYMNEEFLQCRAILASTIDTIDEINDCVLSLISGRPFNHIS